MLNGIAPPRMKDRGESRCMGPEAVLSPGRLWFFLHTGQTGGDGVCGRVRRVGLILLLPASCMQYYESGLVRRNACIRGPPPIDHQSYIDIRSKPDSEIVPFRFGNPPLLRTE